MAETEIERKPPPPSTTPYDPTVIFMNPWPTIHVIFLLTSPIFMTAAMVFYSTEIGPLPKSFTLAPSAAVPQHDGHVLAISERVGEGDLPSPGDLAYDSKNGVLYVSCKDGWIRKVELGDDGKNATVEDLAFVIDRPLGVALLPDGSLAVANGIHGLLKVSTDKTVETLTEEAGDFHFGLTDGVAVADDGIIYFTDASYVYGFDMHMADLLDGRPHGRLMSFDPSTNETVVLLRDLYFANGVAVAPDQQSVIYCETTLRRCRRYHIKGEKKGKIEKFIENMPGFPDNIHSDGEGRYWIALAVGRTPQMDIIYKYPIVRKTLLILERYVRLPLNLKNGGLLSVNLEGKPIAMYTDPGLALVTSGIKIGSHVYYGLLNKPYIGRFDHTKSAAKLE